MLRVINAKRLTKILEVHDCLTAFQVKRFGIEVNGAKIEFDAMWASRSAGSLAKGVSEFEAAYISVRIQMLSKISG